MENPFNRGIKTNAQKLIPGEKKMKNAPNQRRTTIKNVLRMSMIGLILASTIGWTRSAQADLIDVNCSGTITQTWTPGLKLLPQLVSYSNTTEYTSCTSSDPDITAGSISVTGVFMNSCLANIGPTGAFTVEWGDGTTSTLNLQGAGVNVVGNVQIFTAIGTVTSGRFAGDQAVMVNTFVVTQLLACLTPAGLTQLSGSTSLVLTDIL